jgi:acyl-[acyl-carrier-protein]-phospholipid O-acyltransferase/long-chain-fatty-acid--[acyl-carrier-protein] ligase
LVEQGSPLDFVAAQGRRTLFAALVDARDRHGRRTRIIEDQDRRPLSYTDLIRAAFALGRRLGRITSPREHVGVLLPTSAGVVVTVFALHARGRIPVMLNFTAGARNVRSACGAARVRRILSSRRFIAQGRLEDLVEDVSSVADITFLEDIRAQISALDRAYAALAGARPLKREQSPVGCQMPIIGPASTSPSARSSAS